MSCKSFHYDVEYCQVRVRTEMGSDPGFCPLQIIGTGNTCNLAGRYKIMALRDFKVAALTLVTESCDVTALFIYKQGEKP